MHICSGFWATVIGLVVFPLGIALLVIGIIWRKRNGKKETK